MVQVGGLRRSLMFGVTNPRLVGRKRTFKFSLYKLMAMRAASYVCDSVGNARCVNHVHMPQNMAGHGYPTTPHKWLWLVPSCDKYLSAIKYVKPSARLLSIFTNIRSQGLNSSQLS